MKPIIIGLHNPYSKDPVNALAPFPEKSTGHRLWRMLNRLEWPMTREAFRAAHDRRVYMDAFKRYNLCTTQEQVNDIAKRRECAGLFLAEKRIIPGDTVVLLGGDVLEAFSFWFRQEEQLQKILIHPQVRSGITWRWLPHPSGRSTKYNDPTMRMLVGMTLANLVSVNSTGESIDAQV